MKWWVKICCSPLLFFSKIAFSQHHFCNTKNTTTQHNEVLTYKVDYAFAGAFVGAGVVSFSNTLKLFNTRWVYHVVGNGKTYNNYDWFFKVRDVYESYIDTSTMLPLKFIRSVSEGENKVYNEVAFNHENLNAISTYQKIKITSCTQDVLSTIYYARNIDFSKSKPNEKIPFTMYLDDLVYSLSLTYLGKSVLKTKWGKINVIKFSPQLIEGTIFRGGNKMTVFVTDDENKIPIYIETPILVGTIKVYLTSFENIRSKLNFYK